MPAPAKSEAVATVKLNEIEGMKESQPASALQGRSPCNAGCDSFIFHTFVLVELDGGDRLALGKSQHSPPASNVRTKGF